MDRMRRVTQVWNWLPAFRAVAETEHLPTAAAGLHVTPPALSRTLKVLQEDVGVTLFDRVGRGLELNAGGQRLLVAVRTAMRLVHDALVDIEEGHDGPLSIASLGMFTSAFLEPTLLALVDAHPDVVPQVRTTTSDDPASELLQGNLDIVFTSTPFYREGLTTRALGRVANRVFCGPGHALHGRDEVDLTELLSHPFVAPQADAQGRTPEGWPPEHRRVVALEVDRQSVGLGLCATGRYLAVLPAPLARRQPGLWRVPIDLPTSTPVVAVTREPLGAPGVVAQIVDLAAAVVTAG